MAERLSPRSLARQVYVPENDPKWVKGQELIGPEAAWRRNYEYVLNKTGSAETARAYADSIARTEMRQGISGAAPGLISGGASAIGALRGIGGGRNAMTAAEMLAPETRALPAPRSGPSSPVGRGISDEAIAGTSAERAPRLTDQTYRPDVRSVPDEYAMFEGEGGLTSDAIAEARRLARERIAAEKAFRQNQLATMEGEGGGAQAAGEARSRAAAADRAAMEAAINAAESEGMGAAIGAGRRMPSRNVAIRYTGSDAVPARTMQGDLEALMNRHFGGGEFGGLPARGPTYYSDLPNAGPRLVGESFAGESPAYAASVRTNLPGGGMPDWLKYGAPASAALAGGTYLASGRDQEPERRLGSFDETNIGAPQFERAPEERMNPLVARALQMSGMAPSQTAYGAAPMGFAAFNRPTASAPETSARGSAQSPMPQRPQRETREEKGFLSGLLGKVYDPNYLADKSPRDIYQMASDMQSSGDEYGSHIMTGRAMQMDRASGGRAEGDKSLEKALSIIHHLVKR